MENQVRLAFCLSTRLASMLRRMADGLVSALLSGGKHRFRVGQNLCEINKIVPDRRYLNQGERNSANVCTVAMPVPSPGLRRRATLMIFVITQHAATNYSVTSACNIQRELII